MFFKINGDLIYSKFCLIAQDWDRNLVVMQLKGVQLGKV